MLNFEEICKDFLGINLPTKKLEKFNTYYETLTFFKNKVNLTNITSKNEVYIKHFLDSLSLIKFVNLELYSKFLDIGTGAGFPGIPLAILYPKLHLTLIESKAKKVAFLKYLVHKLELSNVTIILGRAEVIGKDTSYREKYDLVLARAVAKLNILAEYCLPFVKVKGLFIAYKTKIEEVYESKNAFLALGKATFKTYSFSLPKGMGERLIVVVLKNSMTKTTYPRSTNAILKKPL